MSTDIRNYIEMVKEEETQDLLFEMANIYSNRHGIDNVVIWVGLAPKNHGLRIKVSNVPGKMDINNYFVIQMPSLDYDPKQVADWITGRTMKKILEWIVLNQKLLYDYETGILDNTDIFMNSISKV